MFQIDRIEKHRKLEMETLDCSIESEHCLVSL